MKVKIIQESENLRHLFIGDKDVWVTLADMVQLYSLLVDEFSKEYAKQVYSHSLLHVMEE
jgi:hypothetical protein